MDHSKIRESMKKGMASRKEALLLEGKLPLFEDGFYKGVEYATLQTILCHSELIMNLQVTPAVGIIQLNMENNAMHLIAHDLLREGLSCPALETINKMIDTFSSALLKKVPEKIMKSILGRYGVEYIPEVPKDKQN